MPIFYLDVPHHRPKRKETLALKPLKSRKRKPQRNAYLNHFVQHFELLELLAGVSQDTKLEITKMDSSLSFGSRLSCSSNALSFLVFVARDFREETKTAHKQV